MRTLLACAALTLSSAGPAGASPLEEAVSLMGAQRYPEAIAVLEREAHSSPGSSEVLLNLGWAYWHARQIDKARKIGVTLVKLDAENPRFLIFLANTDIEKKDYKEAVELARKALKLAPEERDASMVLVRALFMSGQEREALGLLDGIIQKHPDYRDALRRKAVFLAEMGKNEEALAAFGGLLRSDPANSSYRKSRARILSNLGRLEEAKEEWKRLAQREPDGESLLNLGWAYWHDKDLDKAYKIGSILIRLDDKNPAFLRFMANLEIEKMNYSEALELAQKALAASPGDRDARLMLAKAYFRMQREKEAISILGELIREYPDNAQIQYHWADFLTRTGHPAEALPYLDALISENPSNATYRLVRARALYDSSQYQKALNEWKLLASQDEPDMSALRQLRDDAFNKQALEEAVRWQQRIIQADPMNHMSWVMLARIFAAMRRHSAALNAAQKAIETEPLSVDAHFLKAEALEALADWPAAQKAYSDILTYNPNSLRALDGLFHCLEPQADYRGAIRVLRKMEKMMAPSHSPYIPIYEARLLADSGRPKRALGLLRRAEQERQKVIPVLLYHGVALNDRTESVSQDRLREQLAELARRGYQTITVAELDEHFQKTATKPLPKKPLVVTFDDARTDSFENADPILKALGMRATMFVHLSRLRKTHFHASPDDIQRWSKTGRWDMQAHGLDAHDPMPLDRWGRMGHFLASRKWLGEEGRMETVSEFRSRVDNEYKKTKSGVEAIVPGADVVAFAYPYGDYGQSDFTNTPQSAAINQSLVRKYFHLAFVQEQFGLNTLSSNPTDLRRYEVPKSMPADQLAGRLAMSEPWVQAKLLEAELWTRSEQLGRAEEIYAELEREGLDEPRLWAAKGTAFDREGDRFDSQRLFARAESVGVQMGEPGAEERYGKLLEQSRSVSGPDVATSVQAFSDNFSASNSKLKLLSGVPAGPVRLQGWVGQDRYSDRLGGGGNSVKGREAGAELGWFASPKAELNASFGRNFYAAAPSRFADFYGAAFAWQATPRLKVGARDSMGNVETASAILQGRRFHSDGADLTVDPAFNWRATGSFDIMRFNDSNVQRSARLQLLRRFLGLSVGPTFLHLDSRFGAPDYYAPGNLNQYGGLIAYTGLFGARSGRTGRVPVETLLQYEGGYGFQQDNSRVIQSVKAAVTWRVLDALALTLGGQYSMAPNYISRAVNAGAGLTF